jgi:hypothetical protein
VSALKRRSREKDMPRLKNMKKIETSTKQNSLYRCLFAAPFRRNRREDIRVSYSSVYLLVEIIHDSTRRQ